MNTTMNNGAQFISADYFPHREEGDQMRQDYQQANSGVDRFNQALKKRVNLADNVPLPVALQNILLHYSETPNGTTGCSPAQCERQIPLNSLWSTLQRTLLKLRLLQICTSLKGGGVIVMYGFKPHCRVAVFTSQRPGPKPSLYFSVAVMAYLQFSPFTVTEHL